MLEPSLEPQVDCRPDYSLSRRISRLWAVFRAAGPSPRGIQVCGLVHCHGWTFLNVAPGARVWRSTWSSAHDRRAGGVLWLKWQRSWSPFQHFRTVYPFSGRVCSCVVGVPPRHSSATQAAHAKPSSTRWWLLCSVVRFCRIALLCRGDPQTRELTPWRVQTSCALADAPTKPPRSPPQP